MLRSNALVLGSLLSLVLGMGCIPSSLAHDSAPEIGCEPEAITVDEMHVPLQGPSSWRATCDGQRWFCSRADTRVICTEDPT
ncbi:hypothetical protein ACNOYE_26495 [Nannocystaceae bacterium ST9]